MPQRTGRPGSLVRRRFVTLGVALVVLVVVFEVANAWLADGVQWAAGFARFQLGTAVLDYVQGLGAVGLAVTSSGIAARLTAGFLTRRSGVPAPAAAKVVRNLRADLATFTGREEQIQEITQAIATMGRAAGAVVAIHAINGMPGVGKTALALHIGHLVADQFPDGQLFVDLRAHSINQAPAAPAAVLATLLSATGMAPEQIPDGLGERAQRWRDRMAGKRLLLVLDNAASDEQVHPLLPGSAGCLVLVTSRRRLAGLRRDYGAAILPLGVPPEAEAIALFTRVFPHTLTAADQPAAVELVRLCGYLPLAITIVAAGVDPDEHTTVADLLTDLHSAQDRLAGIDAHLDGQELGVDAAFDLSYQRLPAGQQRVLRLLSLTPGADIEPYAAAALTEAPLEVIRRHLRALRTHRLIENPTHDRYRLHDLIAVYAQAHTGVEERDQATERLLDYYHHTAAVAAARTSSYGARLTRAQGPRPTTPDLSSQVLAITWLRAERANILACLQHARRHRQRTRLVDLIASLAIPLRRDGPWTEGIDLRTEALATCREIGDRRGEAWALGELGALRRLTDDHAEAADLQEQALAIFREIGDRYGEACSLGEVGALRRLTGDHPGAADLQEQALAIFREIGDRNNEAWALGALGALQRTAGDYPQAADLQERSLTIFLEAGDRYGEAWALNELGDLRQMTGDYPQTTRLREQALTICRKLGYRDGEIRALVELGALRRITGDYPQAADLQQQALTMCRTVDYRHGEARALVELGALRRITGDYPQAADLQQQALTMCRTVGYRHGEAQALVELGTLRRITGDYPQSAKLLEQALTISRELGDRNGQAEILNHQGALLLSSGDPHQARKHYHHALQLAREMRNPLEEARALAGTGRCAMAIRTADGPTDLKTALEIFRRIGAAETHDLTAEIDSLPPPHP